MGAEAIGIKRGGDDARREDGVTGFEPRQQRVDHRDGIRAAGRNLDRAGFAQGLRNGFEVGGDRRDRVFVRLTVQGVVA